MKKDTEILERHKKDFQRIEQELEKALESRVQVINEMGGHTLLGPGKRLRPLLFILCSRLYGYFSEDLYRLSIVFEYIHTASLLHDDVLDNADVRRKKPSANRLWGNHAAVLEGDFLYSKAFSIAVEYGNIPFLKKLTGTTTTMAEGQVLELIHTGDYRLGEETYFQIIKAKTAVLISAACACGAIVAGASEKDIKLAEEFGMNMGLAFQLVDDLLDYTSSEETLGKPVGKDIREGKVTLPLIYTLQSVEEGKRRRIEEIFKSREQLEAASSEVIEIVKANGALSRVKQEAEEYVSRAASYLYVLPDSESKSALLEMNQYIIERSY